MAVSILIKDFPGTAHLVFDDDDPLYWFLYTCVDHAIHLAGTSRSGVG
jgi:hypothetical protein